VRAPTSPCPTALRLCFGENAPQSMVDFFTGLRQATT